MTDCIFCKIINKEIPGHVLYENDDVLVFLDISQATKGHTLVIPKVHKADVFEMSPDEMAAVFRVVPKVANLLKETFDDLVGLNIVNNNKAAAYQTVFHYHVHLIPRYEGDQFAINWVNNMADWDAKKLGELKDKIKGSLA